jgi:hypothetical protein
LELRAGCAIGGEYTLVSCLFLAYLSMLVLGAVPEFAWMDEGSNYEHQHSRFGGQDWTTPFPENEECAMFSRNIFLVRSVPLISNIQDVQASNSFQHIE